MAVVEVSYLVRLQRSVLSSPSPGHYRPQGVSHSLQIGTHALLISIPATADDAAPVVRGESSVGPVPAAAIRIRLIDRKGTTATPRARSKDATLQGRRDHIEQQQHCGKVVPQNDHQEGQKLHVISAVQRDISKAEIPKDGQYLIHDTRNERKTEKHIQIRQVFFLSGYHSQLLPVVQVVQLDTEPALREGQEQEARGRDGAEHVPRVLGAETRLHHAVHVIIGVFFVFV